MIPMSMCICINDILSKVNDKMSRDKDKKKPFGSTSKGRLDAKVVSPGGASGNNEEGKIRRDLDNGLVVNRLVGKV